MYPLWGGTTRGLASLAHLVFLLRFYAMLPSKSRHRISIAETVRTTQLWLRDASADDIIAFVHKVPIPSAARSVIIEEMETYVTASLPPDKLKQQRHAKRNKATGVDGLAPTEADIGSGHRIGGDRKFFSHFLYWGAYVVSGHGGGVHHPDLTEDNEDGLFSGAHIPCTLMFAAPVLFMSFLM
jgi:hypothetical protein